MKKIRHLINVFLLALVALFLSIPLSSCNDTFSPLEKNDRLFFSVYGYLDLEADTQWIRIMPLRETISYSSDAIDASVTLTNLSTSQTTIMQDSLFQIDVQGSEEDIAYWNFWTDVPLTPNTEYEIRAQRSDGRASSVRVLTPDSFPTPALDLPRPGERYEFIEVHDIDVADVRSYWQVYNIITGETIVYDFNYTQNVLRYESGLTIIRLDQVRDWELIEQRNPDYVGALVFLKGQISIVSAGEDWINFPEMDREVIALPEVTSNIVNGIGYVVGASIKVIPYDSCWDPADPDLLVPCSTEAPIWK